MTTNSVGMRTVSAPQLTPVRTPVEPHEAGNAQPVQVTGSPDVGKNLAAATPKIEAGEFPPDTPLLHLAKTVIGTIQSEMPPQQVEAKAQDLARALSMDTSAQLQKMKEDARNSSREAVERQQRLAQIVAVTIEARQEATAETSEKLAYQFERVRIDEGAGAEQ